LADDVARNAERLVLTCSLCRFILNVGIVLVLVDVVLAVRQAGPSILDYLIAALAASAVFSVFGLAIPHAWAKYAGEKILSRTYRLLMVFALIASPLLYIFRIYDGLVRRLAGVPETTPEEELEEKHEEFLTDLEQHRMEGAVDEEEQEMIENVLELSDSTADQIMTPRTDVMAIDVNSDLQQVLQAIISAGHTRVPVYEENIDKIVGIVYAKDLLSEIGQDPGDFKLRDKMREVYFVPETKPLRTLLHEFQTQKLHIAVVLDEYGGTAGIVTLEDILEELVGEIADEYEETPSELVNKIDDRTLDVDARTYVDDLNDKFDLNLPEDEDYDTIGGFVFSLLGYIPKTGEQFHHKNLKFTISAAEARRVDRLRIEIENSEEQ
jgi:CBS domain containing-hemolysin-like protein